MEGGLPIEKRREVSFENRRGVSFEDRRGIANRPISIITENKKSRIKDKIEGFKYSKALP